jgi:hypothetical protein
MPDLSTVGELADYLATQPRDRKIGRGWSDEDAAPDTAERVIVLGPVN